MLHLQVDPYQQDLDPPGKMLGIRIPFIHQGNYVKSDVVHQLNNILTRHKIYYTI